MTFSFEVWLKHVFQQYESPRRGGSKIETKLYKDVFLIKILINLEQIGQTEGKLEHLRFCLNMYTYRLFVLSLELVYTTNKLYCTEYIYGTNIRFFKIFSSGHKQKPYSFLFRFFEGNDLEKVFTFSRYIHTYPIGYFLSGFNGPPVLQYKKSLVIFLLF